jgi:hypothetical protein
MTSKENKTKHNKTKSFCKDSCSHLDNCFYYKPSFFLVRSPNMANFSQAETRSMHFEFRQVGGGINLLLSENQSIFYYLIIIFILIFIEFNISLILDTITFPIITHGLKAFKYTVFSSSI